MTRRPATSIAMSPVLVGSVTVLVTIVAVYLAYNANNGLPFVPTTELALRLENGANVVRGSEVREGGTRIGVVRATRPVKLEDGTVGAELALDLDGNVDVPIDSRFAIRLRSAVGAKYIELRRGDAERTYPDGGTIAPERTSVPVELDEVLSAFDAPTRRGVQNSLTGLGDGFAGRGVAVGEAIRELPALLDHLEPAAANLAGRRTRLRRFVRETADVVRVLEPVSALQARTFTSAADTFEALSRDEDALQRTIDRAGPALQEGERALAQTRPFLDRATALARDLGDATGALRSTLGPLNGALADTIPVARRSVHLSERLGGTLRSLGELTAAPETNIGLRALGATVDSLQPQIRFIGPAVTVCNQANFFFSNFAETISGYDGTGTGTAYRDVIPFTDPQDDDLSQAGANEFVTGRNVVPGGTPQHLHANYFTNSINEDGTADCEYGGGGYLFSANKWDTTADSFYRRAVVDPGIPGSQGPVYDTFDHEGKGSGLFRERVPEGQTFSRHPGGRAAPEEDR